MFDKFELRFQVSRSQVFNIGINYAEFKKLIYFLFKLKFRITLFKLFILSKYAYCSSLFFHFTDKTNQSRLEKNSCKSLKSYLNVKTKGLTLEEQFVKLKSFNLLPLKLRLFQNWVFFNFLLLSQIEAIIF